VDSLERLTIHSANYRPLAAIKDDVLIIEWDMAVGQADLVRFIGLCRAEPEVVRVAPYLLYGGAEPVWAHRKWSGAGGNTPAPGSAQPVHSGDPTCNLFGLGMTYLPRTVMRRYFADCYSAHAGDVEISMWHYRNIAEEVPVAWDVLPVHLHYPIEGLT
jgi:hypothetical protein